MLAAVVVEHRRPVGVAGAGRAHACRVRHARGAAGALRTAAGRCRSRRRRARRRARRGAHRRGRRAADAGAGAAAAGVAIAGGGGEASECSPRTGPGSPGQAGVTLVCLAYAPNAAVWARAYLVGPGLRGRSGTTVSAGRGHRWAGCRPCRCSPGCRPAGGRRRRRAGRRCRWWPGWSPAGCWPGARTLPRRRGRRQRRQAGDCSARRRSPARWPARCSGWPRGLERRAGRRSAGGDRAGGVAGGRLAAGRGRRGCAWSRGLPSGVTARSARRQRPRGTAVAGTGRLASVAAASRQDQRR